MKNTNTSKIKWTLVLKVYFLKLYRGVYSHPKFQVFGIILTSFRQVVIPPPPPPSQTSKKLTQIKVKVVLFNITEKYISFFPI